MDPISATPKAIQRPGRPLVLVVDDDVDLASAIGDALVGRRYRVATAHNGSEALAQLDVETPQLILLDMWMPVMDGWAFVRAVRERYGRRIPVVVMTAALDARLRADEIGANADLGKPFNLAELDAVLEDTLGPQEQ